jgi:pSer/pThr/pTyr-binding forkhead associated (FHA) protein
MFASAAPSSTSLPVSPPVSPNQGAAARPSRLRGLSYLRNYTQNHLSLHHHQQPTSPNGGAEFNTRPGSSNQNNSTTPESIHPRSTPPVQRGSYFSLHAQPPPNAAETSPATTPGVEARANTQPSTGFNLRNMARSKISNSTTTVPPQQASRQGTSVPPSSEASNAQNDRLQRSTTTDQIPTVNTDGTSNNNLSGLQPDQMPTIKFIPHQDLRSSKPSLVFASTQRTLPHPDCVIRVGRYSERDSDSHPPSNVPSAAPVGFKSKVVSRRHCEFWCSQGQWYIKDVKSSSGTFLNHIRLSPPSVESRPFPVNDGDIVQLGIDFRGGEEMIFRCVKIRIECNRAWQKGLNNFKYVSVSNLPHLPLTTSSTQTHKRLRALNRPTPANKSDAASTHSSECSICLMPVAPCQSLFVAPCSHVWHFKCIRPILNDHKTYPHFLCPNCRAVADLEADVDEPIEDWEDLEDSAEDEKPETLPKPSEEANSQSQNAVTASMQDLSLREASPNASAMSSTSAPHSPTASTGPSLLQRRIASQTQIAPLADVVTPDAAADTEVEGGEPKEQTTPTTEVSGVIAEGPLTPRNNAGPFVFDGSAGRLIEAVDGTGDANHEGAAPAGREEKDGRVVAPVSGLV